MKNIKLCLSFYTTLSSGHINVFMINRRAFLWKYKRIYLSLYTSLSREQVKCDSSLKNILSSHQL